MRERLRAGRYQPQPVRRCEIPEPGGGKRELGIPTVLARRIADKRVLGPIRRYLNAGIMADGVVVDRAWSRPFLGFAFWAAKGGRVAIRIAAKSIAQLKTEVRLLARRTCGRSPAQVAKGLRTYLSGWRRYFRLAETPRILRELDEWIRHRLRAIQLEHWVIP